MRAVRAIPPLILIILVAASCAPQAAVDPTARVSSTATPSAPPAESPLPRFTATGPAVSTILPTTATPLPVVTSRGDRLEATDPDTVNLASGGLQLVEFFAFW